MRNTFGAIASAMAIVGVGIGCIIYRNYLISKALSDSHKDLMEHFQKTKDEIIESIDRPSLDQQTPTEISNPLTQSSNHNPPTSIGLSKTRLPKTRVPKTGSYGDMCNFIIAG